MGRWESRVFHSCFLSFLVLFHLNVLLLSFAFFHLMCTNIRPSNKHKATPHKLTCKVGWVMCCNHFGVYYYHRFDVLQAILVIILYHLPIHKNMMKMMMIMVKKMIIHGGFRVYCLSFTLVKYILGKSRE